MLNVLTHEGNANSTPGKAAADHRKAEVTGLPQSTLEVRTGQTGLENVTASLRGVGRHTLRASTGTPCGPAVHFWL